MNKTRILLIDDEVSFTRLLKLNLEQKGEFEVRVENRSTNAVAVAKEFKPDLMLLDVIMPQLDGGQVAARFKADPALANIPIVFLTATVRKKEVDDHRGVIGGFPFIAKPVTLEAVLQTVDKYVPRKPAEGAAPAGTSTPAPGA
jgi:CheY-like chemotaxis protein